MKQVHFIGIGGVGMSGLATILLERGGRVSGSDRVTSATLERLDLQGARVCVGHARGQVGEAELVVFSSAVQEDNPELVEARERGIPTCRRGEFLAQLAEEFEVVVSVGGSHGKTSTSAMIAHILREAGLQPGYLIGGDVIGRSSPAGAGAGRVLVTEVDESDGTQAFMRSTLAVITNIDDDHCWSLGGVEPLERCFVTFAERALNVIAWSGEKTERLLRPLPQAQLYSTADIPAGLVLAVPGAHNRWNATLAVAVAERLGVPRGTAVAALATFAGVSRRLTERFRLADGSRVVVEDYAHHPEELKASLSALREKYPEHRLVAIFQPHRFERVKRYAAEFSEVLSRQADSVVVTPPFAAWMQDAELADPRQIATAITTVPALFWEGGLNELATALLAAEPLPPDWGTPTAAATVAQAGRAEKVLFAVIGAGDISRLVAVLQRALTHEWQGVASRQLQTALPTLDLKRDRNWQGLTTLGAGTDVPLVVRPADMAELQDVLRLTAARGVPLLVLAAGSNVVGTDVEPPRLVLQLCGPAFNFARRCEVPSGAPTRWDVGAGHSLPALFRRLQEAGDGGAEFASLGWIPGTLGGALRMNAGAFGHTIGEFVVELHGFMPDGTPWLGRRASLTAGVAVAEPGAGITITTLQWDYRTSNIPAGVVLTHALLELAPAAPELAEQHWRETGEQRRRSQPGGHSAGCFFRNPPGQSAGKLLQEAGCMGLQEGHCRVSDLHANFMLTDGKATEAEVRRLMLRMQQRVLQRHGIALVPEVRWAGAEG